MNRIPSHFEEINMIGKLADLKESHYHQSLVLSSLIQVLIDKGLITAQEIQLKSQELDAALTPNPIHPIS
ncbi:hypothetical protein AB4114_20185 [Paenibacillus sp. 2RAB27]|jgi:hypothetical protein|uniref:Uncharacterized protein n=2 Tax=Paenibacillus TaxID=44249 RepID=A0ABX1XJR5_9BACL|nr:MULTISPECIES: hypothetical protein [Paenibacillus]KRE58451.1 hypothetical protein ASL11_29320 [Paenibacillus sp. Soil750]NOU68681.1 hypothetical protein [Paenibacillus plantarum]CAH1227098.1 hypothetical protein PAECIP111891_06066 [Paenibacillus allorhizoplanae]